MSWQQNNNSSCGLRRGNLLKQHTSVTKPQEAYCKESGKYILKIMKKQLTICLLKRTSWMKAAKLQRGFTEKNVLLPEWTKACILPIPSSSPSPVMLTASSSSKIDNHRPQDWKRQKIPAGKCLEKIYFEDLIKETGRKKKKKKIKKPHTQKNQPTYDQNTCPHILGTSSTISLQKGNSAHLAGF